MVRDFGQNGEFVGRLRGQFLAKIAKIALSLFFGTKGAV